MKWCSLILFVLVTSVSAQTSPKWLEMFRELDADGDGALSTAETRKKPGWRKADLNNDGSITFMEAQTFLKRNATPRVPKISADAVFANSEHFLTVDGRERSYVLQLPKREFEKKVPLVVFFHGGGGSAQRLAVPGMGPLMGGDDFIAVYPNAWKGNWNDGRSARNIVSQVEGVDDVKFVRQIVEKVSELYAVDRSRVFAAGISNGAIFSHRLAVEASDVFAGIAPVIGGLAEPLAKDFKPVYPVSLFVIQGDQDTFVPIDGGAILGRDRRGRVIATEEMLGLYLLHNKISAKPTKSLLPDLDPEDGTRTECRLYPAGDDCVLVQYYLIRNGGHRMPGIAQVAEREAITGKVSLDFSGYEEIWKFFKKCPPRIIYSCTQNRDTKEERNLSEN
ncbi:PHB depolymerase family esterase [Pelagicoccus mobilis]|uniref:EF-hand domain-containing protein n=1 Tax=Pelagicoccus mobilis TaxID=415221 RepID=A0A934VSW0_9BACT|nr:PHB depolymerase family esterase [Pelagicoccus mobilis]MBK1879068.1 hypothetical protein [Pelagicoccus mobilis]